MTALTEADDMQPDTFQEPREPRKCRVHKWAYQASNIEVTFDPALGATTSHAVSRQYACLRCGKVKDEALSRRGKSSRRLGNDQERRAERVYGWEKIGERGQLTDLRGRMFKVQQKASRRVAPALFRAIFPGLDKTADQRIPLLLLSFVKQGVGADDYVVIRGKDWLDLHGRDEPEGAYDGHEVPPPL